jgi:glycine/serine hydroxymethyltransferase
MGNAEMEQIARWISDVLHHPDDQQRRATTAAAVRDLCGRFPLPMA